MDERISPLLSNFKIDLLPFTLKEPALLPDEAAEFFDGLPFTEEEKKAYLDGFPRIENTIKVKISFLNALRGYKKKYLDKNPGSLEKEAADLAKLVLLKSIESKKRQIIAMASRKDFTQDEEAYLLEVLKALTWNEEAETSLVACYGDYMYRVGADGNLETLTKPGPKTANTRCPLLYHTVRTMSSLQLRPMIWSFRRMAGTMISL